MPSAAKPPLILVIEDRPEMVALLHRTLSQCGFDVLPASDAQAGLALARDREPSLIILDIGLPDRSGLDVARELRGRSYGGALLMLTARDSVADKVLGLQAGADDYLAKPFDPDELTARVHALLRRTRRGAIETILEHGELSIQLIPRVATWAGTPISLTQREFGLLEFLMRNAEHTVSREAISRAVWGREASNAPNVIGVYVSYLRRKLSDAGAPQILETVSGGGGYVLRSKPSAAAPKRGAREP
jgi:DNA-binding response OmpR family regulator